MNYKEKVIALLNSQELSKEQKEKLENIFPELKEKESVEDGIRKALIEGLRAMKSNFYTISSIKIDDAIAWLEKQGEQKLTLPKWKYKKDSTPLLRDSLILNKYGCVAKSPSGAIVSDVWVLDYGELAKLPKEELEKQGEKKSADKIEPKFKAGDWIVINETTYQITEIDNYHVVLSLNGRECNFGLDVPNNAHLWTINDAKDGDVLSFNNGHGNDCIELIKSIKGEKIEFWFCLINGNSYEVFDGITPYTNFASRKDATPATKEQRDMLFQKMKEAGYEWGGNKKELKKVEPKKLDANKVIEWLNENVANFWESPCNPNRVVNQFKKDFRL